MTTRIQSRPDQRAIERVLKQRVLKQKVTELSEENARLNEKVAELLEERTYLENHKLTKEKEMSMLTRHAEELVEEWTRQEERIQEAKARELQAQLCFDTIRLHFEEEYHDLSEDNPTPDSILSRLDRLVRIEAMMNDVAMCTLCGHRMGDPIQLTCGHIFGEKCLIERKEGSELLGTKDVYHCSTCLSLQNVAKGPTEFVKRLFSIPTE